jgi:hypothetical protein
MREILGAGPLELFGLLICTVPMVFGVWFAVRPSERVLSLMRPLTLMGIFSGVADFVLALANAGRVPIVMEGLDGIHLAGIVLPTLSEGFAPTVLCFGCLTVAWACVAIGMRRS